MMYWQEVAMYGETHLRRVVEMCEELGSEARLEEVEPEEVASVRNVCKRGGKGYTESMRDANRKPRINERNRDS